MPQLVGARIAVQDINSGGGVLGKPVTLTLGDDAPDAKSSRRSHAPVASSAVRAAVALPETIGLLSLRDLAWPMARILHDGVRLNLMSLEALAAAELRDARLCLAAIDDNPQLLAAAAARGRPARLINQSSLEQ